MYSYQGKTALITGASSGIGEVFARMLARRGVHLVLVARSAGKLQELAAELARQHGVRAHVIAADLSREGAVQTVWEATQHGGIPIDILINNAGFGTHGPFETLDPTRQHEEVMLNVTAVVDMTSAFLPAILERGEGAVLNVASTAAFQPVPYMAIYGATKAFVLSFSEALWAEYHGRGLRVLALCPGATETPFFQAVGTEEAAVGKKDTPENVVAIALQALEQGRSYVIPGTGNYLLAQATRLLPRAVIARVSKRIMRPRSPRPPVAHPSTL